MSPEQEKTRSALIWMEEVWNRCRRSVSIPVPEKIWTHTSVKKQVLCVADNVSDGIAAHMLLPVVCWQSVERPRLFPIGRIVIALSEL